MKACPTATEVTPLESRRFVATSRTAAVNDAGYWSAQMTAVSVHRDRASFMRIYDHFSPRLHRYLLGLGVADNVAGELVQESLLRLWRKAELFNPARANLNTWLFRIGRNLYIDHVRREPQWLDIQHGIDVLDQQESGRTDTRPDALADHDTLRKAIDQLPPMQAKLVRMCYLEAKSHREISAELMLPLGSVKSSLRRAFGKLQVRIRNHE